MEHWEGAHLGRGHDMSPVEDYVASENRWCWRQATLVLWSRSKVLASWQPRGERRIHVGHSNSRPVSLKSAGGRGGRRLRGNGSDVILRLVARSRIPASPALRKVGSQQPPCNVFICSACHSGQWFAADESATDRAKKVGSATVPCSQ